MYVLKILSLTRIRAIEIKLTKELSQIKAYLLLNSLTNNDNSIVTRIDTALKSWWGVFSYQKLCQSKLIKTNWLLPNYWSS